MLGYAVVGALLVGTLIRLIKDWNVSSELLESTWVIAIGLLALMLVGALVLALSLYVLFRIGGWMILPEGIEGRSYWGRKTALAWSEIDDIVRFDQQGIPVLKISSRTSKREICACTLAVNLTSIHSQLCRHAGMDHELTQWFR